MVCANYVSDGEFEPRCLNCGHKYETHARGPVIGAADNSAQAGERVAISEASFVNHPAHYGGVGDPYEHIKVVQAWGLNYQLGNATKYICRAGKKTANPIEDLKKARFYLDYEIKLLESKQ